MNLSIETLVTVMVAVLVAGIVTLAVSGESGEFIDWSDEKSSDANCDLLETQVENSIECEGTDAESHDGDALTQFNNDCADGNPDVDELNPDDYCS